MRLFRGLQSASKEKVILKDLAKNDEDVKSVLSDPELDSIFDLNYYLRYVDTIFMKVMEKQMKRSYEEKQVLFETDDPDVLIAGSKTI
ncbi:MAG: hypothetical protein R2883_06795 [Caldisericia bacterium]